jgi:hypothetical protein
VVEGAVVDENAFLEVVLGDVLVGGVEDGGAVVGTLFADGKGEFCARINAAVEDVCDGVAGLFAWWVLVMGCIVQEGNHSYLEDQPKGWR